METAGFERVQESGIWAQTTPTVVVKSSLAISQLGFQTQRAALACALSCVNEAFNDWPLCPNSFRNVLGMKFLSTSVIWFTLPDLDHVQFTRDFREMCETKWPFQAVVEQRAGR